jgi:hypothetical protein
MNGTLRSSGFRRFARPMRKSLSRNTSQIWKKKIRKSDFLDDSTKTPADPAVVEELTVYMDPLFDFDREEGQQGDGQRTLSRDPIPNDSCHLS